MVEVIIRQKKGETQEEANIGGITFSTEEWETLKIHVFRDEKSIYYDPQISLNDWNHLVVRLIEMNAESLPPKPTGREILIVFDSKTTHDILEFIKYRPR